MTHYRGSHPDTLSCDRLVGRTQGDALQLVSLTRDHGPDILHRLFDAWGPEHLRRVTIALAAAVNDGRTPQELWGWLGEPVTNRLSTTIANCDLWAYRDPQVPRDTPVERSFTDEARQRMAERARNANHKRWSRAS